MIDRPATTLEVVFARDVEDLALELCDEFKRLSPSPWRAFLQPASELDNSHVPKSSDCGGAVVIVSRGFMELPVFRSLDMQLREVQPDHRPLMMIWHGLRAGEIWQRAPAIADRLAYTTIDGMRPIAFLIEQSLGRREMVESIIRCPRCRDSVVPFGGGVCICESCGLTFELGSMRRMGRPQTT